MADVTGIPSTLMTSCGPRMPRRTFRPTRPNGSVSRHRDLGWRASDQVEAADARGGQPAEGAAKWEAPTEGSQLPVWLPGQACPEVNAARQSREVGSPQPLAADAAGLCLGDAEWAAPERVRDVQDARHHARVIGVAS